MSAGLVVLLNGVHVGSVEQSDDALRFTYAAEWQESEMSYPLSLSMPVVQTEHGDDAIRTYMEGLLPDNETVLQAWGREFGVSARNPFGLLAHVGEDVAGAVQFVAHERITEFSAGAGSVKWLTEAKIGARLSRVVEDGTSWRIPGDPGYFSLAGAQPKIALLWDGRRWGIPSGAVPTTHILKPPVIELDRLPENEHLSLRLAGELGLPAANSEVREFAGQATIVVERYDRMVEDGQVVRIHQEDCCQALAVSPRSKYEFEGGPGASELLQLLQQNSSDAAQDVDTLVASFGLHWALGAPDAHGKNYSILMAPGGQVRLAPLYDVISVLPYPERHFPQKVKLAMQIGGEYRLWYIRARHWDRFAEENGLDQGWVRTRLRQLIGSIPDTLARLAQDAVAEGLSEEFVGRYRDVVTDNAQRCLSLLDAT